MFYRSDTFIIPELPAGQNLTINIKSTWGDKYYVGLNGIELFADNGEPISITKVGITLSCCCLLFQ